MGEVEDSFAWEFEEFTNGQLQIPADRNQGDPEPLDEQPEHLKSLSKVLGLLLRGRRLDLLNPGAGRAKMDPEGYIDAQEVWKALQKAADSNVERLTKEAVTMENLSECIKVSYSHASAQNRYTAKKVGGKDGIWMIRANFNHASKCTPDQKALPGRGRDQQEYQKIKKDQRDAFFQRQNKNKKDGNWTCPQCKVLNFSHRTECFRCRTPLMPLVWVGDGEGTGLGQRDLSRTPRGRNYTPAYSSDYARPERRTDPDDEQTYAYAEMEAKYCYEFSPEEIQYYWENDMEPVTVLGKGK